MRLDLVILSAVALVAGIAIASFDFQLSEGVAVASLAAGIAVAAKAMTELNVRLRLSDRRLGRHHSRPPAHTSSR